MSYGMTLVKFHNGRMATIPQDAIVAVLVRLGCRVPELREGSNEVGLPHDKPNHSPFGETAVPSIQDGAATSFGLRPPQATRECRGLLFSLIDELKLTMFPDYGLGRLLESRRKPVLAGPLEFGQSEHCEAKEQHSPDWQFGDGLRAAHGRSRGRTWGVRVGRRR